MVVIFFACVAIHWDIGLFFSVIIDVNFILCCSVIALSAIGHIPLLGYLV